MNPGWRNNYLRYKSYFLNVVGRYREKAELRVYIEILLSLATVSVFAIFALRPTLLTIAELIKEIDSKRDTIETMQAKIDNLTSSQILYDRERSKINLLLTSIPDNPNPEIFARQIEGLSGKHGLGILEITVGEAVILGKNIEKIDNKTETFTALPEDSTQLSITATYITGLDRYLAFSNLISDFERSRRPAKIDIIRVTTVTTEEDTKELQLTIEARLPIYRNKDN